MNLVKLNGIEKEKDLIIEVLEETPNTLFFLDSKKEIFDFLDELGLDGYYQYIFKIGREVKLPPKSVIKSKSEKRILYKDITTLSSALHHIEESNISDYKLVLDTEEKLPTEKEKEILSEIIQQLIYLDIDLEVLLHKEEHQKMAIEIFLNQLPKLNETVKKSISKISKIHSNDATNKLKLEIIDELSKIEGNLEKASNKKFSIALLAPRRTGKSMVINCFLGKEYAPTTGELPTPTNCVYEVSPDNKLRVIQENKAKEFATVKDLRNYLFKLFTDAKTSYEKGFSIPEVTIQYIPENNFLRNYTIIDTPGPNIAGALMHKEFAKKWIKEADVVLYVFEYMHERDSHAVNYFNEIKTYFEKYDKFYSLITIDNKLDLIYANRDNPSIIRTLSILRYFLKDLNFKSFAMLGTSALQYFNSVEILDIPECKDLNKKESTEFKEQLSQARKAYRGKYEQMSIINYVRDQVEKLEDFHQIDNPTLKTLKKHSGIERLVKFTKYIATEKAGLEVFRAIMRGIDDQYSLLKSKYIILQFKDLEKEKEVIAIAIKDLIDKLDEIKKEIHRILIFTELENELIYDLEELEDNLINILTDNLVSGINDFRRKIEAKAAVELKQIKKGNTDELISLETNVIEKYFNNTIGSFARKIKKLLSEKESEIRKKDETIRTIISNFQEKLSNDYNIDSIDLTLPTLDPSFEKPNIYFDFEISHYDFDRIARGSIEKKEGVVGWIVNTVTSWLGSRTNARTGKFALNEDKFRSKLKELEVSYKNELKISVHNKNKEVKNFAREHLKDLSKDLQFQSDEIFNTYNKIFKNILDDLKLSKDEVEAKIAFLKEIEEKIEAFNSIWLKIRLEK